MQKILDQVHLSHPMDTWTLRYVSYGHIVAQGKDIPNVVALIKSIETSVTNVIISVVNETQIKDIDKLLSAISDQEKSIPETENSLGYLKQNEPKEDLFEKVDLIIIKKVNDNDKTVTQLL
ncbi:unnamed protein product [Parnassius apollo]|uniref:(apollo) hypothetical protein n=1 Tax=Parnassius apollo TaxID=110799 RepID=A0A8S3WMH7_PARAO|nr:unnamed protein product [Parnassius apollo]